MDGEAKAGHRQQLVNAFITSLWVATGIGVWQTWALPARDDLAVLIVLVGLTIAGRMWKISLYQRGHTAIYPAIIAAGAIYFGPTTGALLGVVAGLVHWPWKSHPRKYIFDAGQHALTAIVVGSLPKSVIVWSALPPGINLIATGLMVGAFVYVISWGLVITVMTLDEWLSPFQVWKERCAWLAPHFAVYGCLAIGMAKVIPLLGASGLLIYALPLFMMRVLARQFIDHTRDSVLQLREAHEALATEHASLERAYGATRTAFSGMLRARDDETEGHSERVTGLARLIGKAMHLAPSDLSALELGAQLHDVGKVGVPDAILLKPGKLTAEEWLEMRRHPVLGSELIANIPFLAVALPVVLFHHERWDGSGYPDGLQGVDIPLNARIFAVADVYDALVSDRPYRRGMHPIEAIAIIERDTGSHFDPMVVAAFLEVVQREDLLSSTGAINPKQSAVVLRRRDSDWKEGKKAVGVK